MLLSQQQPEEQSVLQVALKNQSHVALFSLFQPGSQNEKRKRFQRFYSSLLHLRLSVCGSNSCPGWLNKCIFVILAVPVTEHDLCILNSTLFWRGAVWSWQLVLVLYVPFNNMSKERRFEKKLHWKLLKSKKRPGMLLGYSSDMMWDWFTPFNLFVMPLAWRIHFWKIYSFVSCTHVRCAAILLHYLHHPIIILCYCC